MDRGRARRGRDGWSAPRSWADEERSAGTAPAGRPAFWRLFETALEVDPDLPRKGASPLARLGLRIAARRGTPAARRLSPAILLLARVLNGVRRRIRLPARSGETEMPG